jgi:ABC-type lipoprotein export system ATPase subunit/ABC-type antimicrobial peptide transport system permease subunit
MSFFCCKNISKSYGNENILKNININFPSKGLVFLTGPSGCGKSTFIYCLLGIEENEGKIYFKDKLVSSKEKFRQNHTSIIFQNFYLLDDLTVKENILLISSSSNYLNIVKKLGIDNLLNKKVRDLSGGEKQRVAIARSLIKNPDIIFADEITGSLDKKNSFIIMDLIKEISKDKLVIMISHDQELVEKYNDYVIVLKENLSLNLYKDEVNKTNINNKKLSLKKRILDSIFLMRKSKGKLILSFLSLIISFVLLGLILNVSYNFSSYLEKYKTSAPDYQFLELAKTSTTKIEGTSFSLVKSDVPTSDDLDELKSLISNYELGPNMSTFINSYTSLRMNGEKIDATFCPYLDINGEEVTDIYVNPNLYEKMEGNYLEFFLKKDVEYKSQLNKITQDTVRIALVLKVKSISKEMNLFDTPRIYYPYNAFNEYFKKIKLENLSNEMEKHVSLYSRLSSYTYDNDIYSSHSLYLIPYKNDVPLVMKIINSSSYQNEFSVTSRSITSYNTINTFFEALKSALGIFVSISSLISFMVLILSLNSLIIDERKEIAIFKSLGVTSKEFNSIYLLQILYVILSSFLTAFIIKFFAYLIINRYVTFISLTNLKSLQYENSLSLIFTLGISLCAYLFGKRIIKKLDLSKILKEE